MTTTTKKSLLVIIDEDRLRAYIKPATGVSPDSINQETVVEELKLANIAVDDRAKSRITEFLNELKARKGKLEKFLIAEAQLPVEAKPGRFQWAGQSADAPDSEDSINSRIKGSAILVERDAVVGKVFAPTKGEAGYNVMGEILRPKRSQEKPIQLASGVKLEADGVTVIAKRAGRVVFAEGQIAVVEAIEISRDIKPGTVKTDWEGDVIVRGIIGEAAKVATTNSLVVTDAVEAAEATAKEDVIVSLGVLGQGKGKIKAGRDVVAKFCEDADIQARRDVLIDTNVVNSRIKAGKRMLATNAAIIGGEIHAGHCVEARILGSEGGVSTVICVGSSGAATGGSLSSSDASESPYVRILSKTHERIQITIEDRTTLITNEMKGPIRIEKRKIRMASELVAVTEKGGNIQVLKSKRLDQ